MIDRSLSVTEVNRLIKTLLDSNGILRNLMISGEISNFNRQASGHLYFSLKDENSRIDCVMFKNVAGKLKFLPENGMQVNCKGAVSIYEKSGRYQVYVRSLEPAGIGGLQLAFEQRKGEYERLGWFAEERKKELPTSLAKVGVVTSASGAALRDIISVISRRNPLLDIVVYPALVQGEMAAAEIAAGIAALDERADIDVIIAGRGGGSLEDLWAFNEEAVVAAIHHAHTPIISAVGHETDFTLADFVADMRAATPSVAGELVSGEYRLLVEGLVSLKERLVWSMEEMLDEKRMAVENLAAALTEHSPRGKIDGLRINLDLYAREMGRHLRDQTAHERERVKALEAQLRALNPLAILSRGYLLALDEAGQPVTSARAAAGAERLKLKFHDGEVTVLVHKESADGDA